MAKNTSMILDEQFIYRQVNTGRYGSTSKLLGLL